MRIFRFALLQSYFSIINKNKKKALLLINIGIFFTIFAISSAMISFFIEKKISNNQNELLALQISVRESSNILTSLEIAFNRIDQLINIEEDTRIEKQFLSETKLGNKIFSENDFYDPYIYFVGTELEQIERSFKIDTSDDLYHLQDLFDINSEWNQEILNMINKSWDDDDIKEYTDAVLKAKESLEKIKRIDFENYKQTEIPSLRDITIEILNYKSHHINKSNSKIADDYFTAVEFEFSIRRWFLQILKFLKAMKAFDEEQIEIINKSILSLSKKEKNIILSTFIFQLIVFTIIQFFEVNSLNYQRRKKLI